MRNLWIAGTVAALICLGLPLVGGSGAEAVPFGSSAPPTAGPPVEIAGAMAGGDDYFFCAATQVAKYVGIVTGNVGLIVGGAIAGGIACGFGW